MSNEPTPVGDSEVEALLPAIAALLRVTIQSFDNGGESMRSLRALAVETAWHLIYGDDPRFEAANRECDADQWAFVRKMRLVDKPVPRALPGANPAAQGAVEVGALEWTDGASMGGVYARCAVGGYFAYPSGSWTCPSAHHVNHEGSIDGAKAAAQADYEQRIRSALAPEALPASGGVEAVTSPAISAVVKRLLNPPFGTETSERLLMGTAADAIRHLAKQEADIRAVYCLRREENMELVRENKRLDREWEETLALLRELHAIVKGECPSLLNEDSGGNGELAIRIEAALSTSAAAGRIGPMADLRPEDVKIETYPIPGIHQKGGQQCGVPSGVRITHSSGVTAYVDIGRSQHINKMIAEDMILSAITHPRFRP